MKPNASIILKKKADRPVLRRHPWVFSGAVARVEGKARAGELVALRSSDGKPLARGLYNPDSRIVARLLSWNDEEALDESWWRGMLERAVAARASLPGRSDDNARRLVFAEADGLPGLIVDRYADWLVLQAQVPGVDRIKPFLAETLMDVTGAAGVYERSHGENRALEGLPPAEGLLAGRELPENLEISENGLRFTVDPAGGQKTGFYLDQRVNRDRVASYAGGVELLDVFAHTGAFSATCLDRGAASAVLIDSSTEALQTAKTHLAGNNLGDRPAEFLNGDAFHLLRQMRDEGRSFDLIVLDPPKFAPTRAQASKAARGYKDINLLAVKLLRPGGILATFSCSAGVDADLFQKILFGAALDAGRDVQILERLTQSPDHPVHLCFPESSYLKGLICRAF